jgi:hypothetical protein
MSDAARCERVVWDRIKLDMAFSDLPEDTKTNPLGSVDTYRSHKTIAARVTTARQFRAVFSKRVATRRNCLSFEKQHSTKEKDIVAEV